MMPDSARRNFLKMGGAGIAGVAVGGAPPRANAKPAASGPTAAGEYDVKAFGAKGDGKTLDTRAINRAIAAAASADGGTVRFPPGSYLCYSIHLKGNIALHLGPGSTIVAADSPTQGSSGYDPPEPNDWDKFQDFGHSHWHNSLFWGESIDNLSIVGPGLIWGKGLSRGSRDDILPSGVGNKAISLKNCRNVTLRVVSILHGGHYRLLPECAGLQLQRQFALGRRHLSEELLRAGFRRGSEVEQHLDSSPGRRDKGRCRAPATGDRECLPGALSIGRDARPRLLPSPRQRAADPRRGGQSTSRRTSGRLSSSRTCKARSFSTSRRRTRPERRRSCSRTCWISASTGAPRWLTRAWRR